MILAGALDTYAWNGAAWTALHSAFSSTSGPVRVCFEPARSSIIGYKPVYPGYAEFRLTPTGWQSTGIALPLLPPAITFHERAGHLVAFGPFTSSASGGIAAGFDLLNGAWVPQMRRAQPLGAEQPGMAFDQARGVTVLFGGGLAP